ncbi:Major facilitator superfamily protein [Citrus sinensis]|uniref:Major facilitator superfamily protein n=1 Tax=Citrus sinensis TaxID=2711 RepID=A0ACB8KYG3_CITSI|nr:Major facilitator superfamily protein [Citrus sinensis]
MEKKSGVSHLFITIFVHCFSTSMVAPAITDVTMSAVCPGRDECSLAIYLSGFQQAIIGLGTLVMMPLVGNLSDKYGRKALLTVPITLSIIPLGPGTSSMHTTFSGLSQPWSVKAASIASPLLTWQIMFLQGDELQYLEFSQELYPVLSYAAPYPHASSLLPPLFRDEDLYTPILSSKAEISASCEESTKKLQVFKRLPSIDDMVHLLKSSPTFSQAAIVAFLSNLADAGLQGSMMYYLKAKFHFNKNQFADLMVIAGIAGTISQLIMMPVLAPTVGEARLLSFGLLFGCVHMFLYSVAWSSWVPYAAAVFSILSVFSHPCLRTIVSKQVASNEQGKAQGCISGICSFANLVSPLAFSPLTALFLSDRAPFNFPGFSIMCIGFVSMTAFIQSIMIRVAPPLPVSSQRVSNCNSVVA